MKNKKGFTLVELLSVIVILAVILVIAVPTIMDTINNARKGTLESTAKLIASSAEKRLIENQTLGIDKKIKCSDVVELDSETYGLCKIEFDEEGNASVILNGKEAGKFDNMACSGTKDGITCEEGQILPGLNCTYDGELIEGAEFVHNQYTYRYKQEYIANMETGAVGWSNLEEDGWGVVLTDKISTEPVNTPVCSYINGKPLLSTSMMFVEFNMETGEPIPSQATTIDVSEWETDNVKNMFFMFAYTLATEIKGLEYLETENVSNMMAMFMYSNVLFLDVSSWDVSDVTNMAAMFQDSAATTLNLKKWDTSNVTDMRYMFMRSQANSLDLSEWNTSSVTDMNMMFRESAATTINLNGLNLSNVTDMSEMFQESAATTINLNGLNTSNVINMNHMFYGSAATSLDLSSFDTSKVTNMSGMFMYSAATTINLSELNTTNVTDMSNMFYGSAATSLDLSSFDTSNVTDMGWIFDDSKATTGYARTEEEAAKFNDASVTSIPSTLTFTVKASTN